MRKIEFRGKTIKSKKWIFGDLLQYAGGTQIWEDTEHGKFNAQVFPETIGEFTGLCDRKGVEIFEGDVVRGCSEYFGNGSLNCRALVVYAGGQFMLSFGESVEECAVAEDVEALISWSAEVEIIGNVHDNPGLLRGGAEYKK